MNTLALAPIRTYDRSLDDKLNMYDNMPYKRDDNLCNRSTVKLISGNVIKYYRYKLSGDYVRIPRDSIL